MKHPLPLQITSTLLRNILLVILNAAEHFTKVFSIRTKSTFFVVTKCFFCQLPFCLSVYCGCPVGNWFCKFQVVVVDVDIKCCGVSSATKSRDSTKCTRTIYHHHQNQIFIFRQHTFIIMYVPLLVCRNLDSRRKIVPIIPSNNN